MVKVDRPNCSISDNWDRDVLPAGRLSSFSSLRKRYCTEYNTRELSTSTSLERLNQQQPWETKTTLKTSTNKCKYTSARHGRLVWGIWVLQPGPFWVTGDRRWVCFFLVVWVFGTSYCYIPLVKDFLQRAAPWWGFGLFSIQFWRCASEAGHRASIFAALLQWFLTMLALALAIMAFSCPDPRWTREKDAESNEDDNRMMTPSISDFFCFNWLLFNIWNIIYLFENTTPLPVLSLFKMVNMAILHYIILKQQ